MKNQNKPRGKERSADLLRNPPDFAALSPPFLGKGA